MAFVAGDADSAAAEVVAVAFGAIYSRVFESRLVFVTVFYDRMIRRGIVAGFSAGVGTSRCVIVIVVANNKKCCDEKEDNKESLHIEFLWFDAVYNLMRGIYEIIGGRRISKNSQGRKP